MEIDNRANQHAKVHQLRVLVLANDTGVAAHLDLVGSLGDSAAHKHNLLGVSRDGSGECGVGGDGRGSATSTTSGASILAGVTSRGLFRASTESVS